MRGDAPVPDTIVIDTLVYDTIYDLIDNVTEAEGLV